MKTLAIGSVVKVGDKELMIIGYSVFSQEEKVIPAYLMTGYPRGFAGKASIASIKMEDVKEVLAEGYQCESGTVFTDEWNAFADRIKGMGQREFEHMILEQASLQNEKQEVKQNG